MRFVFLFLLIWSGSVAQQSFSVYFDFNIDVPNADSKSALEKWMAENPKAEVIELIGHADSVDENNYNRALSFRRIMSVVAALSHGKIKVNEDVILEAKGEDFKQDRKQAKNRRVDIVYNLPKVEDPKPETPPVRKELVGVEDWGQNGMTQEVLDQFDKAKPGDIIRINNIHFFLNSEKMIPESSPVLVDLYRVMVAYPEMVIEIHGHMCCNGNTYDTALSYRRAKFIFEYLINGGIATNRLAYKGFGTARPIFKVPEKNLQEEQANRRVEILIKEPLKVIRGK